MQLQATIILQQTKECGEISQKVLHWLEYYYLMYVWCLFYSYCPP